MIKFSDNDTLRSEVGLSILGRNLTIWVSLPLIIITYFVLRVTVNQVYFDIDIRNQLLKTLGKPIATPLPSANVAKCRCYLF